ncbi:MAG: GntR family transcriptional regulator [Gaiellaceae bacterium]
MTAVGALRARSAAVVDRASPLPVYFQIAIDLRRRLGNAEWERGSRIAPETALARHYEVSRVTVRQAIAELVKDDLLERRQGSGTYVAHQQRPLVYDLNLTVGALASQWRDAKFDNRAEVIEAGIVDGPANELRSRLRLSRTGTVVFMVRRVLINDRPTVLYRSWFDRELVPGLEFSSGLSGSLSKVLAEEYGLAPVRSDTELEVVRSTREEVELLQASSDTPLVVATSTSYLADGQPLEHAQLAWLGDRVRFHITAYDRRLA